MTEFTRQTLGWKNNKTFPCIHAKGADVKLLIGFVAMHLSCQSAHELANQFTNKPISLCA